MCSYILLINVFWQERNGSQIIFLRITLIVTKVNYRIHSITQTQLKIYNCLLINVQPTENKKRNIKQTNKLSIVRNNSIGKSLYVLVERFQMTVVRVYFSSCAAKSVRMNNNNPDMLWALSAHCVIKRTEYMVAHALSVYPIQQKTQRLYMRFCTKII